MRGSSCSCARFGEPCNRFCASLKEETRTLLCAGSQKRCIPCGTWGERKKLEDQAIIIQEGMAIVAIPRETNSIGVAVLSPGNIVNIVGLSEGLDANERMRWNRSHRAYIAQAVSGCRISCTDILKLAHERTDLSNALLQAALSHYISSLTFSSSVSTMGSEQKVDWLLDQLNDAGVDTTSIRHSDFAQMLNMNRVTVTHAFGSVLSAKGL